MRWIGVLTLLAVTTGSLVVAQSPGGSSGEVQYNNNGGFGGTSGLTYDSVTEATSAKIFNNARYLHLYATTGDGSDNNPWTPSSLEWSEALAGGGTVVVVPGSYQTLDSQSIALPSGTTLQCQPGAIFKFPSSSPPKSMFKISANATGVSIKGCEFQPGITVPDNGEVGGIGHYYLEVGDSGSTDQASFTVEDNVFGRARYQANTPQGRHIQIESGTVNSSISNNRFNSAQMAVNISMGHATAAYRHDSLQINYNTVAFDVTLGDFNYAFAVGAHGTDTVPARFDTLEIQGNTFRSAHGCVVVGIGGESLSISNNVAHSDLLDLIVSVAAPPGERIDQLSVVGNTCFNFNASDNLGNCMISANNVTNAVISSNALRAQETAINVTDVDRAIVTGNVVNGSGTHSHTCVGISDSKNVAFSNNQLIDCGTGSTGSGFSISTFYPSEDLSFFSNTFVQTQSGTMQQGFLGVQACTDCIASNNYTRGSDLPGGFADAPDAFIWSENNFGSADPSDDVESDRLILSDGVYDHTLVMSESQAQDLTITFPPTRGLKDQILTASGTGITKLSWNDPAFVADSPVDTFTDDTLDTGNDYINPDNVGNRDPKLYAEKKAGTGGPFEHEWVFPDAGVKTGTVEVWHRLFKERCTDNPPNIATQDIFYATDGSSPTLPLGQSGAAGQNPGFWTVSSVELVDQDLKDVRVRAVYNPNGSGGTLNIRCRAQVAVVTFNESENALRYNRPRRLVLESAGNSPTLGLRNTSSGDTDSPGLTFEDGSSPRENFTVRKSGDTLAVLNDSGAEVLSVSDAGVVQADGKPVLKGSGSDEFGPFMWGDGSPDHDSGDEVCAEEGLACVTTTTLGGTQQACSSQHASSYFLAFCK